MRRPLRPIKHPLNTSNTYITPHKQPISGPDTYDAEALLPLVVRAGFHRVAVVLYRDSNNFAGMIDGYLKYSGASSDAKRFRSTAFSALETALMAPGMPPNPPFAELQRIALDRIAALVAVDCYR